MTFCGQYSRALNSENSVSGIAVARRARSTAELADTGNWLEVMLSYPSITSTLHALADRDYQLLPKTEPSISFTSPFDEMTPFLEKLLSEHGGAPSCMQTRALSKVA